MTPVFIHIPKTGGRSILKALGQPWSSAHHGIAEKAKANPEALGDKAVRFAVVRNPWDRVLSMWMFFGHMCRPEDVKPFDQWLLRRYDRFKRTPNAFIRPIIDQMSFCCDAEGKCRVDRFLRFESLQEDWAKLAAELGIKAPLPHLGREEKQNTIRTADPNQRSELEKVVADYHTAYTSQGMIDAVAAMDSRTIEKFGYSFK